MNYMFAYSNGKKMRFLSIDAVAVGGIDIEEDSVTLFAPRLPPLRITHKNPKVILEIGLLCVGAVTKQFPNNASFGVDLNVVITALEATDADPAST